MSVKATEKENKNLTHPIRTRVNRKTYQRLVSLLQNSTCQSMGELARKLITREKINCFYKDVTMNAPMEELTSIRKELKAIGISRTHGRSPPTEPTARAHRPKCIARTALFGQIVEIIIEHRLNFKYHENNSNRKRKRQCNNS